MSQMLNQLKKIINSERPIPADEMRIKYARLRATTAKLNTEQVKAGIYPGQGAADNYPAGYPL